MNRKAQIFLSLGLSVFFLFLAFHLGVAADKKPAKPKQEVAVIQTSMGKIIMKFYPDVAPNHVDNFKKLARQGFYDGTIFHRVIPGFMIQGGDPNTKSEDRNKHGMGGSGKNLKAEFSNKQHKRGTVSMARSMDPNSASSQFFICVAPAAHLDGQYTAFGEVMKGMDVVDKIVATPRDPRDNPLQRVVMKKVTIEEQP